MARRKIQLADGIARVVYIETDATKGATIGTNLYMPGGEIASPALLRAYIGAASSGASTTQHSQLQGLDANDHPQYALTTALAAETAARIAGDNALDAAITALEAAIGPRVMGAVWGSNTALVAANCADVDVVAPIAGTITKVQILTLGGTGSCAVDVWKDSYANFPPTDADSITASAVPSVSSGTKSQDTTLTGWTKTVAAGDIFRFHVDSTSTFTRIAIILTVTP